ncbi:MAG TPA: hypothetical protein VM536_19825, partial [Chloroflexia bacterium]|nr:hypothetical protein [Chloroflexia bacterium]
LWVKPEELMLPDGAPAPVAGAMPGGMGAPRPPMPVPGAGPMPPASVMPPAVSPGMAPPAMPQADPAAGYAAPRPYQPPGAYQQPGAYPQRPEAPRPPRPMGAPGGDAGRGARPAGRGRRDPVVMPATDGQITEIMRLAARLNLSTEEIEEQFGRGMDNITRFDAREWIKKLREDAIAKAPPAKVHFGQWPGLKDDREAVYLAEQRELGSEFRVALINGQTFNGRITDFTPYTITLAQDTPGGVEQVVLRKLAVAYYQRTVPGNGTAVATPAGEAKDIAPFAGSGAPQFAAPGATTTAEAPAMIGAAATAEAAAPPTDAAEAPAKPKRKAAAPKAPKAEAAADGSAGAPSGTEGAPSAGAGGEEAGA